MRYLFNWLLLAIIVFSYGCGAKISRIRDNLNENELNSCSLSNLYDNNGTIIMLAGKISSNRHVSFLNLDFTNSIVMFTSNHNCNDVNIFLNGRFMKAQPIQHAAIGEAREGDRLLRNASVNSLDSIDFTSSFYVERGNGSCFLPIDIPYSSAFTRIEFSDMLYKKFGIPVAAAVYGRGRLNLLLFRDCDYRDDISRYFDDYARAEVNRFVSKAERSTLRSRTGA
jgi:hypothetical protein